MPVSGYVCCRQVSSYAKDQANIGTSANTRLFFIPSPLNSPNQTSLPLVVDRLTSIYNPTHLGRWTLDHRLLRDTSSILPQSDIPPRFVQFINLSYIGGKSFVAVSPQPTTDLRDTKGPAGVNAGGSIDKESGMTMIEIPAGSELEFLTLITKKMEPLWVFRQHVRVDNGQTFETDDWRIRVGDVRQVTQARVRGCVVEVQVKEQPYEGADGENDWAVNEAILKRFWKRLGIEGAREYIRVPGVSARDSLELPRQYVELLRLNRVA